VEAGKDSSGHVEEVLENQNPNWEASETTSEIPKYTFEWKEVENLKKCYDFDFDSDEAFKWRDVRKLKKYYEHCDFGYDLDGAIEETKKRWLIILNIEELYALWKDYNRKFHGWRWDRGIKTTKNPLWLNWGLYLSTTTDCCGEVVLLLNWENGKVYQDLRTAPNWVIWVRDSGEPRFASPEFFDKLIPF
jgi:hypothetical protein